MYFDDCRVGVGLHRHRPVIDHGRLGVGRRGGAGVLLKWARNQRAWVTSGAGEEGEEEEELWGLGRKISCCWEGSREDSRDKERLKDWR